jgi:uncharacterized hydrophobic protein (TIGR00271 family)
LTNLQKGIPLAQQPEQPDSVEEIVLPEDNYYAKTVLIPIGRPDTAAQMLELAGELVHPTEGLVIALVVALGDTELANKVTEEVEEVIENFRNAGEGHNVELVTEVAVSISRGILDVARERNTDVIILGVNQSARRQVKLGTVVENVITAAPCGVLIYRSATSPTFNRVVIPVDGTVQSTTAMKLGVSLALQNKTKVRQMSVQYNYQYHADHETAMREAEALMPSDNRPYKQIVVGRTPERNILREMTENDLLVMGFSQKTDFERQITDDLSNQLLNRAPGPVIMISRIEWQEGLRGTIERSLSRINPHLTHVEQNELVWAAQKNADPNLDFTVMIVLSAGLATLGLLTNSVAVIIGAMLVAPLMSPISGFSTGMATGLLELTRRASFTMLQGVILALLISIGMGLLLPIDSPTSEMLSRGSPGVLDAAVALVSGLVAAYASARKGIPAALAGVAIAAALMPPLCVIGLGVALQHINMAIGATLLFLANITFIIASQYITFLWLGMRPDTSREGVTANLTRVWWGVLASLTAIVLIVFIQLGSQAVDEQQIRQRLEETVFQNAEVVDYTVISSVPLGIQLTVQSATTVTSRQVEDAQDLINEVYEQEVAVEVIAQQIIRPADGRNAIILEILKNILPTANITEVGVKEQENLLTVNATIRDVMPPPDDALNDIQTELAMMSDGDVQLNIAYQQVIFMSISGTAGEDESESP